MKKIYMITILVLLAMITIIIMSIFKKNSKTETVCDTFLVDDYKDYISDDESKMVITIKNCLDLKNKATDIMIDAFGNEIVSQKPFKYYYDNMSDSWMIEGSVSINMNKNGGGKAHLIIDKNGIVIAKWKEK